MQVPNNIYLSIQNVLPERCNRLEIIRSEINNVKNVRCLAGYDEHDEIVFCVQLYRVKENNSVKYTFTLFGKEYCVEIKDIIVDEVTDEKLDELEKMMI